MTKTISVTSQFLSLRGCIRFAAEDGAILHEAVGELALLAPTWRLYDGPREQGRLAATVRRKLLAWAPTWEVELDGESFRIRKKLLSWTRSYHAVGGVWDGAVIDGNFWDMDFTIRHRAGTLAVAARKLLSLRDRHCVELFGEGERFVALAMLVLMLDQTRVGAAALDWPHASPS